MRPRTVGDFIAEVFKKTGLNQGQIAKKLKLDAVTISNWKRNKQYPKLEHIQRLLDLLQPKVRLADCLHLPEDITSSQDIKDILDLLREIASSIPQKHDDKSK